MDKNVSYFTFGVNHPYGAEGMIQKIIAEEPREIMIEVFGSNWAFEYFPKDVTENDDGTVTIHGKNHDYTYRLLPVIKR